MKQISRRSFLENSIAAGAALTIFGPHSKIVGANDTIRVAVVGFRSQGSGHIERFHNLSGVRVVALCDVDCDVLAAEVKKFTDRNEKVDAYVDYRKLLEDKNIDAIVTATPNHWHALATVWACQAGKDIYVEKPVSHNIWEGRKTVEAARKYNRIVQTGTQKRSDPGLKEAFEYIQKGSLGKILYGRGFCYKRRKSIGKVDGPQPIPPSVDYDLWCGPAPKEPLMRQQLHYDWHWVWPTGNGDIGNQGIHEMDLCRWALGQDKLAPGVMSIGGRFGYIDDGQTPNTQIAILDYKPAPIIFEVRGLPQKTGVEAMDRYRVTDIGVVIQCKDGYFAGGDGGGWAYNNNGKKIRQFKGEGGGSHHENFIKAVRSRKVNDLNADIEEGHISSALCHLANVSYRLGSQVKTEKIAEIVKADKEALDSFERFKEHLAKNNVDLKVTPATLGPWLKFDPDKEIFTGQLADEANKHLSRDYRRPFIVPQEV